MQVPKIIKNSDIIHPPPPDAATDPLQTVTVQASVVLAAGIVVASMVVQVRVAPEVGRRTATPSSRNLPRNPINKKVPMVFFTYLDGRYSAHV